MNEIKLIARRNSVDHDMIELYSIDNKILWAITHCDFFTGTEAVNSIVCDNEFRITVTIN